MVVLLSPIGGAGWQFFNNDGTVLSGGKLYTYSAGTTTPAVTFTTVAGNIQHSNPIVLNSAGRVSSGEVWLTNGLAYKFVLKDSADVLIATYDNILGIFSATNLGVLYGTGTGSQTVYNLGGTPGGTNLVNVYINGVYQNKNTYTVSGSNLTFSQAPPLTSIIEFNYY
jgi:hypothetical protein